MGLFDGGSLPGMALISGGANLLGSAINAASMAKYNQTQKDIARMNNEYNYRMFQEQNAFNVEQWERENEYNTPYNQMLRMQQAGINPYMSLGNMSSGNATGAVESAVPTPAVTPQLKPNLAIGEGLQQAANASISTFSALANVEKTLNEAKGVDINNQTLLAENMAKLRKMGAETEAKMIETQFNRNTLYQRQNILDATFDQITAATDFYIQQAQEKRLQNNITETYGLTLAQKQVDLLSAQTDKFIQEVEQMKELLPFEKALKVAQKVQAFASANNMNMQAWQIGQITDDLADYYSGQAFSARMQGNSTKQDTWFHWLNQDNWYKSPSELQFEKYHYDRNLKGMVVPNDLLNLIGFGAIGKGLSKGRMFSTPTVSGFR